MKQPKNGSRLKQRRSREENRAITRSRIIQMARKHFLTRGYAGTILEHVAEEAGFSRGALYSNFSGKEDLFLAVFDTELHMHVARYHEILDGDTLPGSHIDEFRKVFVNHVTDHDWGILRTEFEMNALRSDTLRKRFTQIHRRDLEDGIALAQKAIDKGVLVLSIPADELVLATQSFMMGLAVKQRLLVRDFTQQKLQAIAETFFDCFIATRLSGGSKPKPVKMLK